MSGDLTGGSTPQNSTRKWLILTVIAIVLAVISIGIGKLSYSWLPPQAAAESILVDDLFSFLVTLGAFIFLGVTGTIIYSVIFHRAAKYDMSDGPHIEGNVTLEIIWTAIPILLVFWIAGYSYQVYQKMAIKGPMEVVHLHMPVGVEAAYAAPVASTGEPIEDIEVIGKQWAWVFRYPEDNITSTELHLPTHKRVRLALKSEDVLHGFYIPAFRLKQDIIPSKTINFEFTPIREGTYQLTDSQFSGTYFATMTANVVVESLDTYQQWLANAASQPPTAAPNQAAAEYAEEKNEAIKVGWPTIKPAPAPLVNYHN
ncbi:cytochrome C oxidase subunit II, periplasmic domain protein [Lyngbya aestuarii BL J]|uniref:Cytochrome c oxidase subunit 2 n=1 Tax=Lyngbya aestuarii BL J TaxID=1348334 RepID=U7QMQ3_9CYAN|nr:cytochrome c oxidase subunit II [Lyngbya aestuarii]ERT09259.1 cytochrome C oxidase subunit II, periplasmic domain protein [Lyngbya aestuarii BL J]